MIFCRKNVQLPYVFTGKSTLASLARTRIRYSRFVQCFFRCFYNFVHILPTIFFRFAPLRYLTNFLKKFLPKERNFLVSNFGSSSALLFARYIKNRHFFCTCAVGAGPNLFLFCRAAKVPAGRTVNRYIK